jgi:hypothetical protein
MAARHAVRSALPPPAPAREICLELIDNSTQRYDAVEFFGVASREPFSSAAKLCAQFAEQNRALLSSLGVRASTEFNGRSVALRLDSGNPVGAIPLLSPSSAQPDLGLVIQPRFPWSGIGPMLATMGWRVTPTPLKLPLLRRSERRVPPWVLSATVLTRLQALLDRLERRFEMTSEIRSAPRGRVDWAKYATASLPRANFLKLPCAYPDLLDDRQLRGAIRFSLERQQQSLNTQRQHGSPVHQLLDLAGALLERVRDAVPLRPSSTMLESWQRRPLTTSAFQEGLQAVEWTAEDRGLAGLSDLEGIPWKLSMDAFFEAWVESVFVRLGQQVGGRLRVGRTRETTHALRWSPGWRDAQRSLVPDLMLDLDGLSMIIDAKYKRHWEEMGEASREEHRRDLLQVLAYANLARAARVVACLIYPCRRETWESLWMRRALVQRSSLTVGARSIQVWLTAMPMNAAVEDVIAPLAESIREQLRGLN